MSKPQKNRFNLNDFERIKKLEMKKRGKNSKYNGEKYTYQYHKHANLTFKFL